MSKKKQSVSQSMKSMIRQHDAILAVLMVATCLCGLFLMQLVSVRYHAILNSSLYLNSYKTALEETHSGLEEMVYSGTADETVDFTQLMLQLYREGEQFPQNISNGELWRDTTDLQHMTRTFLTQASSAYRLAQAGYSDAAVPMYEQCSRTYELILQAYNDCYERLIVLNEREQMTAQRYSNLLLVAELLFSVGVLAFSFTLIMRLANQAVHPIEVLTKRVSDTAVEDGELELLPMEDSGVAEVDALQRTYNRFVARINRQFGRIKEAGDLERQLLEEEAKTLRAHNLLKASELKALQSQINPHFLFNSLNMITSSAYLEGAEQTTTLMELLGGYLRYNLDKLNKAVTVTDEIENVTDYLKIQKVRMGERFDYDVRMDEGSAGAYIPCLTLQPLVENAISHGLRNCVQGGKIRVQICAWEDRLHISVRDNGMGIEPAQLEQLNRLQDEDPLRQDDGNGIGVRNVVSRLQLYFNGDIRMKVTSIPGCETEFLLDVPLAMEEVKDGLYTSDRG